jgi:hypothetical protein
MTNRSILEGSNSLGNATNRLLKAVDELGDRVDLQNETSVRLETPNTAVEIWDLSKVLVLCLCMIVLDSVLCFFERVKVYRE